MIKVLLTIALFIGVTHADTVQAFYSNGGLKYKITFDKKTDEGCKVQTFYKNGSLQTETFYTTNKECYTLSH